MAEGQPAPCRQDEGTGIARIPRGITRKRKLLAAVGAALQFPAYFGGNWDALEECLNDLSWLKNVSTVCLVHSDLPCAENAETLATYLRILRDRVQREAKKGEVRLRVFFPTSVRGDVETALKGAE